MSRAISVAFRKQISVSSTFLSLQITALQLHAGYSTIHDSLQNLGTADNEIIWFYQ